MLQFILGAVAISLHSMLVLISRLVQ